MAKVVICGQENFWFFWLWQKVASVILVFIEPPCRATAIYLESESPFVFSFFRVFSVFSGYNDVIIQYVGRESILYGKGL